MLSKSDMRELSARLSQLADHQSEIIDAVEIEGFGAPASAYRSALLELAGTDDARSRLLRYWYEYAKEKFACLSGPSDILRRKLPEYSAYRSEFLDWLYSEVNKLDEGDKAVIASPQIEPTLKRYVEMLPDEPFARAITKRLKETKKKAVIDLGYLPVPGFAAMAAKKRYGLLTDRFAANLRLAGFSDAGRQKEWMFSSRIAGGSYALLFVDDSRMGVEYGMLTARYALAHPDRIGGSSDIHDWAFAVLSPDDIIPGFRTILNFDSDSSEELFFSADACICLSSAIRHWLDIILSQDGPL